MKRTLLLPRTNTFVRPPQGINAMHEKQVQRWIVRSSPVGDKSETKPVDVTEARLFVPRRG